MALYAKIDLDMLFAAAYSSIGVEKAPYHAFSGGFVNAFFILSHAEKI